MKKGDFIWILGLVCIVLFLVIPETNELFVAAIKRHPYIMGFVKFSVLATMGELLASRIISNRWAIPSGLIFRALIWGFLGMTFIIIFEIFSSGVGSALSKGLLPGGNSKIAFAFFTSAIMNLTFAPTMMTFHRITDTYINLKYKHKKFRPDMTEVVDNIDWQGLISFVLIKTIPFFWIPAHTITFLLPGEYRVMAAAFLSIALGAILAFGKKESKEDAFTTSA